MNKRNKRLGGLSVLIVIFIVLVVVALGSAFSYYYLRPEPYSDFEKELNLQDVENLEVDFQELDSSASNL